MIHGATRKTTVSVKIGVSSKPWDGGGQRLGSAAPRYASPRSPRGRYLLGALQQRDVESHQPCKAYVGEGESLHVEDALLLMPAGFDGVGELRAPQHVLVVLQHDAVCGCKRRAAPSNNQPFFCTYPAPFFC